MYNCVAFIVSNCSLYGRLGKRLQEDACRNLWRKQSVPCSRGLLYPGRGTEALGRE